MGRPKSYDRADVLDRATRLFWTRGYEATHLADLVQATGLNRFSLYNEFGGKEGLYLAALEHYMGGLGRLVAHLDHEPLGLANVRAFHRAQLEHEFAHGCFALNTIRERLVVPAPAWSLVEVFKAALVEKLRANLRAAAASGELSPDRDPDLLAGVLAVFDMGLLTHRSAGADAADCLPLVEEIERLLA